MNEAPRTLVDWKNWFAEWCVRNEVTHNDQLVIVKGGEFYTKAQRMFLAGRCSDRVVAMQLAGALGEIQGAARAHRKRS